MAEALQVPLDDATLGAIEHALGTCYEVDEHGERRLVGGAYTLTTLLDWLSGCYDRPGTDRDDHPAFVRMEDIAGIPVYYDIRTHISRDDLIRALVAEVRRLRGADDEEASQP